MGGRLSRSSGSRSGEGHDIQIVRIDDAVNEPAPLEPFPIAAEPLQEVPVLPDEPIVDDKDAADAEESNAGDDEAASQSEAAPGPDERSETERLYLERERQEKEKREASARAEAEAAKNEPTGTDSSSSSGANICKLCDEEQENVYTLLTCGHDICLKCAFRFLGMAVPEREEATVLECPYASCNAPIALEDVKAALLLFGSDETDNDERCCVAKKAEESEPLDSLGVPIMEELRSSVGTFSISLTKSLEIFIADNDNIVRCPNKACGNLFERIKGGETVYGNVKDDKGKPLSDAALAHYNEHRFRCRLCDVIFCSQCGSFPYHLGFTCKEFIDSLTAKKCRYCDVSLSESANPYKAEGQRESWVSKWRRKRAEVQMKRQVSSLGEMTKEKRGEVAQERLRRMEAAGEFFVCANEECKAKALNACAQTTKCLHLCGGVRNEASCLRCLKEECCRDGQQTADDYCNICWVESLGDAPCVELKCGHVFHHACLSQKLCEGFPTPYISFSYATCPLCDCRIDHPMLDTTSLRQLEEKVRKLAEARLVVEMMEEDEELKEGGEYFGRPADYAMTRLTFYECFKCKEPYYGGKKACGDGADEAAGAFSKEDLICSKCSGLKANCPLHHQEYIEFKCRFCCSLATFFCGGLAHFCTPCHDRAGEFVDFGNWETKPNVCGDCPGPGKCPLGVLHPPNGEEYSLGCSMCRAIAHKDEKPSGDGQNDGHDADAEIAPPPGL